MTSGHSIKREPDGTPSIDQHIINGWAVTYNPDDERFHVARPKPFAPTAARFREMRNAVSWAKGH